MKDKVKIRYVFFSLAFVAGVGWWLQTRTECVGRDMGSGSVTRKDAEQMLGKRILLPGPFEWQEWINECPDVNIKVDGKHGPETTEGHGIAFCYQQGIYHCQDAGL